ncbi:type II toxin-antitoxin system HicB family antitoxin [Desulfonatronospira sp.]|uniref:type II toxin-antitoxin system HicB family antitoxin n=1 Tax=Desulfonatronospira sp. TaxID=1962951 RepID=UPI00342E71B1
MASCPEAYSPHATSKALNRYIEDYREFCAERGENPEKPYSGKFLIRIGPELHKNLAIQARKNSTSLNAWVTEALSKAVKDSPLH